MLSERVLRNALRVANRRIMSLSENGTATLPPPDPEKRYMLYAHVPFCERLCPYCSFNRFPFAEDVARCYFRSLRQEMRMVAEMGYDIGSLYVGGGTPTILLDELCGTLDLARALFAIDEVSCETNPNHLVPEVLDALDDRVQRMSVGVQSFDDELLREMDRYDKYGSGDEMLERLQETTGRFHSLNADMIFNFPSQTRETLARDIECVKLSGVNQTTFYPLMTSPSVRRTLSETVGKVSYRREREFYQLIREGLADTFEPASGWTFSRMGGGMIDEYIVDYEEYVGIGSGAFSYLDGSIYVNTFSLEGYGAAVGSGHLSVMAGREFEKRAQMAYRFMMGLFGLELDKRAFERDFGVTVERGLFREMKFMQLAGAFDTNDDERLTLSDKGEYLLVAMMREFFAGVNAFRDQAREGLPTEEKELLMDAQHGCSPSPGTGIGR